VSEALAEFGRREPGRSYRVRRAVYAVILDDEGRVATVGRRFQFLPGGGVEAGETLAQALARECREECACAIELGPPLGEALQWFEVDGDGYEGRHAFFAARFVGPPSGVAEYELEWLEPDAFRARSFHRSHVWAVERASAAARAEFFRALRASTAEYYLSEPGNPYRESGRGKGAARWEETRRCIADAVHRSGDFMDVGCANGLLLETLRKWCAERGFALRLHGIDFVPELVALARARHPAYADHFAVANAWDWEPRRRYDFVRLSLEIVPASDRAELVRRIASRAVAPGGRLIVCHYADVARGDPRVDVGTWLESEAMIPVGRGAAPGVSLAWIDCP
jgi:8-oxo-dGTP pyrophosphatase MutT (NUDIX family)